MAVRSAVRISLLKLETSSTRLVQNALVLLRQRVAYVGHIQRNSASKPRLVWSSIPLRYNFSLIPNMEIGRDLAPSRDLGNG
jgi:hypothetical protein